MAVEHLCTGIVSSFDDAAGLGEVTGSDGSVFAFHCTAIADGTRAIDAGQAVAFRVVPAHRGVWEATDLRPLEAE